MIRCVGGGGSAAPRLRFMPACLPQAWLSCAHPCSILFITPCLGFALREIPLQPPEFTAGRRRRGGQRLTTRLQGTAWLQGSSSTSTLAFDCCRPDAVLCCAHNSGRGHQPRAQLRWQRGPRPAAHRCAWAAMLLLTTSSLLLCGRIPCCSDNLLQLPRTSLASSPCPSGSRRCWEAATSWTLSQSTSPTCWPAYPSPFWRHLCWAR